MNYIFRSESELGYFYFYRDINQLVELFLLYLPALRHRPPHVRPPAARPPPPALSSSRSLSLSSLPLSSLPLLSLSLSLSPSSSHPALPLSCFPPFPPSGQLPFSLPLLPSPSLPPSQATHPAPFPMDPAAHERLSYVREARQLTAAEDRRIASAIGGQLAPLDFQSVFLKALEFKRRLLALRVIQRRSRAALRARAAATAAAKPQSRPRSGELKARFLTFRVMRSRSNGAGGKREDSGSIRVKSADQLPEREAAIVAGIKLLSERLSFAGLAQEPMVDDGACQFRALSYQLFGTQDRHIAVRRVAVNHIRSRPDEYGIYFLTDREFLSYVTAMEEPKTWGDEFTLRAAADAYGCSVHVLTSDSSNWHLCYEGESSASVGPDTTKRKLFLTYIAPVHYNSVRREDIASLEAAEP